MRSARRLVLAAVVAALAGTAASYVNPITLANDGGLHFGDIVAGVGSGTVTIAPGGTRSSTGSVRLGNGIAARAAAFIVTGDSGAAYTVTLPASATLSSGANSMTINTFTHDSNGLLTGGTQTFRVGGTLQVPASQPSGSYSGTFSVTVTYQ